MKTVCFIALWAAVFETHYCEESQWGLVVREMKCYHVRIKSTIAAEKQRIHTVYDNPKLNLTGEKKRLLSLLEPFKNENESYTVLLEKGNVVRGLILVGCKEKFNKSDQFWTAANLSSWHHVKNKRWNGDTMKFLNATKCNFTKRKECREFVSKFHNEVTGIKKSKTSKDCTFKDSYLNCSDLKESEIKKDFEKSDSAEKDPEEPAPTEQSENSAKNESSDENLKSDGTSGGNGSPDGNEIFQEVQRVPGGVDTPSGTKHQEKEEKKEKEENLKHNEVSEEDKKESEDPQNVVDNRVSKDVESRVIVQGFEQNAIE